MQTVRHPQGKARQWLLDNDPAGLQVMLDQQPNGKRIHRFWQRGGGYDRNIVSVEEAHEKLTYIHENPVTAQLVDYPSDWQWSSYNAWEKGIDKPISIDRDRFPEKIH